MQPRFLNVILGLLLFCGDVSADWAGSLAQTNRLTSDKVVQGSLQLFKDDDGGVYALKVVITNMSTNDLVLQLSDVPINNLHVILRVGGKPLQKDMPDLKNFEGHVVEMKLNRGSSIEWFVRLSDHLKEPNSIPDSTSAGLAVLFRFAYFPAQAADDLAAVKFANFDFLVAPITVTSNSIRGNAAEKYERRERK